MKASHIDTCLGCYLTDHHNRPGELLLGSIVDGSTTYRSLQEDLIQQVEGLAEPGKGFSYVDACKAIREMFADVGDMDKPFDASLEVPNEDEIDEMLERCEAWVLLSWDVA